MSVITAAGPYTLDKDLDYAPLAALVDTISVERPDLVILVRATYHKSLERHS